MPMTPALALQRAFYAALTNADFQASLTITLGGAVLGVYDRVPGGAKAPYVVISNIIDMGQQAQGWDPGDLRATLMIWSAKPGKVELQTIIGEVRPVLAPNPILRQPPFDLSANGHRLLTWRHLETTVMDDRDGVSVKASMLINYLTEPTGS